MDNETASRPAGPRYDEPYDDEINLMEYLVVLWRYRWVIVAATVLCGAAALAMSLTTPRSYQATVKLMVTQSKMAETAGPTIGIANFRALLQNQSLAKEIIDEFGLDKPPYLMRAATFVDGKVAVDTIRDTNIIVVTVRLPDPDLAAKVANRMAQRAVEMARTMSQEETVRAQDVIRIQLDQSQQHLAEAERRLETFKKQAQIELLRKDVDAMLGQRGGLLGLLVEIQSERARLAAAEGQLAKRERVESVKRSIDTDPAFMEAAKETAKQQSTGEQNPILGLELRNEFINPVYDNLDQVIAASRTKLAGLEKQRAELVDVRKLDGAQSAQLSQLYTKETELAQLQTEYDLAKNVYVEVATRYAQARLQVAGRSAELQMFDTALPPDRPMSRNTVRNFAIAVMLGLILSMLGVLFYDYVVTAGAKA